MALDKAYVPVRLRELRERSGLAMEKLARRLGYKGASSYQRYESLDRAEYLDFDLAERIADAIAGSGSPPITRNEVLELAGDLRRIDQQQGNASTAGEITLAGSGIVPYGLRDLPILGQSRAGDGRYYFDNGANAHSLTYRPMELLNVSDAYAVYVNGDSMSPRFKHGELVYIDPHRPPAPGDDVVVQLRDGQGFIKELVRRTARVVICRQHNPAAEVEFAADNIRSIHLIISATKVRA